MDFDHDHEDDLEGEIAISFAPRFEELERHGITPEQFESALLLALEEFETLSASGDIDPDQLDLEEIKLHIGGADYRLADLADIEISDGEDEEEEEFDDIQDEEIED